MQNVPFVSAILSFDNGQLNMSEVSKYLIASTYTGGSKNYCSLAAPIATTGVAVTTGKIWRIRGLHMNTYVATGELEFGYCDNDVGLQSNTAPVNPVLMNSGATRNGSPFSQAAGIVKYLLPNTTDFDVPAGKYMFIHQYSGSGNVGVAFYISERAA